jgi:hypothetical protein
MKPYYLLLLLLLLLANCKKDDPAALILNPANFNAFPQADSACIVNTGDKAAQLNSLSVITHRSGQAVDWITQFDSIFVLPGDTFKYDLRKLPHLSGMTGPNFQIPQNDSTLSYIKFWVFDHSYTIPGDPTQRNASFKVEWFK